MDDQRIFPAKLLLFGEHILLLGAPALAVPVPSFGGCWQWGSGNPRHHARLLQFAQSQALRSAGTIDCGQFEQDLRAGLFFESNIPTGYGLGSSGALCAAIYERYAKGKTNDLAALKNIFAQMESFFHGSSSGIDPLTSFVGKPILIESKTEVRQVPLKAWEAEAPVVFLLDSRLPRRTGPLVEWFLAQNREDVFAQKIRGEYLPAHEAMLLAWLSADTDLFWPNLRRVSVFQFENFIPMIPHTLADFWEKSFEEEHFCLKICGAGGGGFVLGFAKNIEIAKRLASQIEIAFPFA